MTTATPILKFASIRNANDLAVSAAHLEVQPTTNLVTSLLNVLQSYTDQSAQIAAIKKIIQTFVAGASFYHPRPKLAGLPVGENQ